jgi:hypothetical protein
MTDTEDQIEIGIESLAPKAETAAREVSHGVDSTARTSADLTRDIAERVGSRVASILQKIKKSGK